MREEKQPIKTYRHETLQGALAALKEELGEDAYILHTKQVSHRGMLGIKSKLVFEIQACERAPAKEAKPRPSNALLTKAYNGPGTSSRTRRMGASSTTEPSKPKSNRKDKDLAKIEKDVEAMKMMLKEMVLRSRETDELTGLTEELQALHAHLLEQGVKPCRAKSLVQTINHDLTGSDLRNPRRLREFLRDQLVKMLPVSGAIGHNEGRARVVAFIGPTGVGKTTTISKLAGYCHHYEQRDVGLMTIDTYRIAATEQLHRVAEIVDVPIRVETSPQGLSQSLEQFHDRDLVLIDTAGRSPRDTLQMNELKKFMEAASPDETYLVLPATQDVHALEQVLATFGPLADRLVLSKLDEASRLGPLLDLLMKTELPVSYWTFGQSIPDDIATVNPRRLVSLILGEETL